MGKLKSVKRNLQLDYLKIVMAIAVISIHTSISSSESLSLFIKNGPPRAAVPLFYIINGFFLFKPLQDFAKFKKLLLRILLLYGVWMLIYSPFYQDENVLLKIFNGFAHLWYLIHLALAMVVLYTLKRLKLTDIQLLIIALLLFFTGWTLQLIKNYNFINLPHPLFLKDSSTRNFLFFSFPLVFLGYSMNTLRGWDFFRKNSLTLIIIGLILLMGESIILLVTHQGIFSQDFFPGTLLIAPALFLYINQKAPQVTSDDFFAKLYVAIYLTHYLAMELVQAIFPQMQDSFMKFVLILFMTLLLSTNVIMLNKKIPVFL